MKIGVSLSFSDDAYAFWVFHFVMLAIAEIINDEGFDESNRLPKSHIGIDVSIWLNGSSEVLLKAWGNTHSISKCPSVYIYNKIVKPRGCNWVEVYVRFNFDILKKSTDRISTFVRMCHEMLQLVELKTGVKILALENWESVRCKIMSEIFTRDDYKFTRDEESGVVIF